MVMAGGGHTGMAEAVRKPEVVNSPCRYGLNKVGYSQISLLAVLCPFFSGYTSFICDGMYPSSKMHPRLWESRSRSGGISRPSRCVATLFTY